jgi:hypothetical protein
VKLVFQESFCHEVGGHFKVVDGEFVPVETCLDIRRERHAPDQWVEPACAWEEDAPHTGLAGIGVSVNVW